MMQKSATKLLAGIVAVVLLGMISTCAEERSLSPQPPRLRIYAGALDFRGPYPYPTTVFVYDADSLTLVDSFPLPVQNLDLVASENGCWLYALTEPQSSVRVLWRVSLQTHAAESLYSLTGKFSELPVQLFPLNQGSWLLLGRDVVDIRDGHLVRRFPDSISPGVGPTSGYRVPALIDAEGQLGDTVVRGLDVATGEMFGRYVPRLSFGPVLSVYYTALHPDNRRVLVIGQWAPQRLAFVIGDLSTGETLLESPVIHSGEILVTLNGRYAVVTSPWSPFNGAATSLDVFDLDRMALVKRFVWEPGETRIFDPGQLAEVPGTDRIVAAPLLGTRALLLVDLSVLDTITILQSDPWGFYLMGGLAVGYGMNKK